MTRHTALAATFAATTSLANPAAAETELTMYYPIAVGGALTEVVDGMVADFMAGAVEYLTPDNDSDHWDHIEGQGSLFHVSYSGVTMALIHGGQPDALVLCHEPTRKHMRGLPDYDLPSLENVSKVVVDESVIDQKSAPYLIYETPPEAPAKVASAE